MVKPLTLRHYCERSEAIHGFCLLNELNRLGAHFEKAPNWQSFTIVDDCLITGQNPAASTAAAEALLKAGLREHGFIKILWWAACPPAKASLHIFNQGFFTANN